MTTISHSEYEKRMGCLPASSTTFTQCHDVMNYTHEFTFIDNVHYECCDPRTSGNLCNERLQVLVPDFTPPAASKLAIIVSLCVVITCTVSVVLYICYR